MSVLLLIFSNDVIEVERKYPRFRTAIIQRIQSVYFVLMLAIQMNIGTRLLLYYTYLAYLMPHFENFLSEYFCALNYTTCTFT